MQGETLEWVHSDLAWLDMVSAIALHAPSQALRRLEELLSALHRSAQSFSPATNFAGANEEADNRHGDKPKASDSLVPMEHVLAHNVRVLRRFLADHQCKDEVDSERPTLLYLQSAPGVESTASVGTSVASAASTYFSSDAVGRKCILSELWLAPPVYGSVGVGLRDDDMMELQWKVTSAQPNELG